MCQFHTVAITNDHKLNGLNQHRFIILQLPWSEIQHDCWQMQFSGTVCLPRMHKALGSVFSTEREGEKETEGYKHNEERQNRRLRVARESESCLLCAMWWHWQGRDNLLSPLFSCISGRACPAPHLLQHSEKSALYLV